MLFAALVFATSLSPAARLPGGADEFPARAIATLPRGLTSHAAAALDGWLYVYGGYFGEPHEYCREDQSRAFQRLNLRDGVSWEVIADEAPVQSAVLVAHRGSLLRLGGLAADNERHDEPVLRSLSTARRFDPSARRWLPLPEMPAPRSSHAACVVGDKLVVVGGWDVAGALGRASRWHDDVWLLDLEDPAAAWTIHPAPLGRRAVAAASVGSSVYVIGGMDAAGRASARVDVLDTLTMQWSTAPELPETGFGCAATAVGGTLYASARSGRVWRLERDAPRWVAHDELRAPRSFHQLVAADPAGLYAIGGIAGGRRTRLIERIELDPTARPRVETLVVPSPAAAKNRQALALQSDALFFFGGNQRTGQHDFEDDAFVDEGWRFDLSTLEWSQLPPSPARRQSMQLAWAHDRAWLVGGFGRSSGGTRAYGDLFVFEPRQASWLEALDVLRPGRTQFALVPRGDGLWIFGGLDYVQGRERAADFHHPLEVLRRPFDAAPEAAFEGTGIVLPRPRRAFGHAELDGRLYLVGGLADGFASVPECDVFDFATSEWSTISAPRAARISPELVALDGKLHLVGGAVRGESGSPAGPQRSIERFDPASGEWSVIVERLPFDPTHLRLFVHRGRLLVVSTHDEEARVLRLCWITT